MDPYLITKQKVNEMKKVILVLSMFVLLAMNCNGQPNTSTTIEVGIVNPQPAKHYEVFLEIKDDTLTSSQLVDGMDYLDPDVSGLIVTLENVRTVGDTLFGEITYQDLTFIRFIKGGLVQVDNATQKYSSMITTFWTWLDAVEPNNAGFFIRRKQ
jgi:hypothetical protein